MSLFVQFIKYITKHGIGFQYLEFYVYGSDKEKLWAALEMIDNSPCIELLTLSGAGSMKTELGSRQCKNYHIGYETFRRKKWNEIKD